MEKTTSYSWSKFCLASARFQIAERASDKKAILRSTVSRARTRLRMCESFLHSPNTPLLPFPPTLASPQGSNAVKPPRSEPIQEIE
jgi:hypothetical protein